MRGWESRRGRFFPDGVSFFSPSSPRREAAALVVETPVDGFITAGVSGAISEARRNICRGDGWGETERDDGVKGTNVFDQDHKFVS